MLGNEPSPRHRRSPAGVPASYKLAEGCPMALLLRRTTLRAMLSRGSTWSRSTDPAAPPAFLTSLDNPQTYFDSSELRAVGGLETQPQSLNAETEKVLTRRGLARRRQETRPALRIHGRTRHRDAGRLRARGRHAVASPLTPPSSFLARHTGAAPPCVEEARRDSG